jgi:hypothetical protein
LREGAEVGRTEQRSCKQSSKNILGHHRGRLTGKRARRCSGFGLGDKVPPTPDTSPSQRRERVRAPLD